MHRRALVAIVVVLVGCVDDPVATVDQSTPVDAASTDDLPFAQDFAQPPDQAVVDEAVAGDMTMVVDLPFGPSDLAPAAVWVEANSGLEGGSLYGIATGNGPNLYVQTLYDLFVSTDYGTSFTRIRPAWALVKDGISAITAAGTALYFAPGSTGVMMRPTAGDMFVDLTAAAGGEPPTMTVTQLFATRGAALGKLFAIVDDFPYLYTGNANAPWAYLDTGAPVNIARGAVADDDPVLYASANTGLITWDDGWTTDASQGTSANALDVRGSKATTIERFVRFGTTYKYSSGSGWNTVAAPPESLAALALRGDGTFVGCGAAGIYKLSTWSASTWSAPYTHTHTDCSQMARSTTGALHVATARGVYTFDDVYVNGFMSTSGITATTPTAIVWHPTRAGAVFVGTLSGLFGSNDSGTTWASLSNKVTGVTLLRFADEGGSDALYLVTDDGALAVSIDGKEPAVIDASGGVADVAPLSGAGRLVYGCAKGNLVKASGSGTFAFANVGTEKCNRLTALDASTIFAQNSTGLVRITNLDQASPTLTKVADLASALQILPASAGEVWVLQGNPATSTTLLHWTSVDGISAVPAPTPLASLALGSSGTLYAAGKSGVYRRPPAGLFEAFDAGLPGGPPQVIGVAPNEAQRMVGLEERGIYRAP